MAHYLLSVHTSVDDSPGEMSNEQVEAGFGRIAALEDEMRAAAALVASGRLDEAAAAAVVRAPAGRPVVTDGPFAESKEILGGFYIIEASSRDVAVRWAARTSAAIGMPIEVRGFFGFRLEEARSGDGATPANDPL